MNQQDKNYAESICRVIQVLPADKREYLMGVADGMAAMSALVGGIQEKQQAVVGG